MLFYYHLLVCLGFDFNDNTLVTKCNWSASLVLHCLYTNSRKLLGQSFHGVYTVMMIKE